MPEYEGNNSNSVVTTETSVGMTTRQLQNLLNNVITTLRADILRMTETKFQEIVTMIETNNSKFQAKCSNLRSRFFKTITKHLDSKFLAATENITAKIQQENEKHSENLTQKLRSKVKKLSFDLCTFRNDTENKFQKVTMTVGGVSDAWNLRD